MEEGFCPGPGQGAQTCRENLKVRAGPAVLSLVKSPSALRVIDLSGLYLCFPTH